MESGTVVEKPTTKQARVLGMVAKGKNPSQIAKSMGITVNGVYGHMRKLRLKGLLDSHGKPTSLEPGDPDPEKIITLPDNGNSTIPESMTEVKRILNQAIEVANERVEAINERLSEIRKTQEALNQETNELTSEAEWLENTKPTT